MAKFNYQTNRIINGICEYCGIPATKCEHYRDGQPQPLDEKKKLEISDGAPSFPSIPVEPLKDSEKAASVEEAKEKMDMYARQEADKNKPAENFDAEPQLIAPAEPQTKTEEIGEPPEKGFPIEPEA